MSNLGAPIVRFIDQDDVLFTATGTHWLGLAPDWGRGVFRSFDEGRHWHQINEGLTDTTIMDLAIHSDGTLLAVTYEHGIFRSANDGDTWEPVNDGLADLHTTALAIAPDGIAYVGTSTGVYRSTSTIATSAESPVEAPRSFALEKNFPNPFNSTTRIRFQLPEPGFVTLTIYDMLGREVAWPVNDIRSSGTHEVAFDAPGLPGGVYLYRLVAGANSATRTLTILK